jgi:hypothetical protein
VKKDNHTHLFDPDNESMKRVRKVEKCSTFLPPHRNDYPDSRSLISLMRGVAADPPSTGEEDQKVEWVWERAKGGNRTYLLNNA